jgi:uncharacterized membrane protein (UPF0127 family)
VIAALLLTLLMPQAGAEVPAVRCLPGNDGFITMRLRGSIEREVRWTEPALECTGMSRPDGKGLRVRFAGAVDGGELAIVFAAPELGIGRSSRSVPVNVTLLDGAGERIYGTQGDSRCEFDAVEQRLIEDGATPGRSYRISARGFCVAPARALDGEGSVLLTRFDFAGRVTADDIAAAPAAKVGTPNLFPSLEQGQVQVTTSTGVHDFGVWIAADDRSRQRGLMYVRELPPDRGMLFIFERPQPLAFWMKDTYLSLDLIFVDPAGRVLNVAAHARPQSLEPIRSDGDAIAVLEVLAGTARTIDLKPGDRLTLPTLRTTGAPSPKPAKPKTSADRSS